MSENNLLKMSSSPHIRDKVTTGNIMLYVVIALLPASAFGVWNFGFPALIMLITTTVTAVLTEYIYEKLMHKRLPLTIGVQPLLDFYLDLICRRRHHGGWERLEVYLQF